MYKKVLHSGRALECFGMFWLSRRPQRTIGSPVEATRGKIEGKIFNSARGCKSSRHLVIGQVFSLFSRNVRSQFVWLLATNGGRRVGGVSDEAEM